MLRKVLTAKAAAVAGALLLTTTGAAAATGSLPGAAQTAASDALAKVGITVPGPNSHAGTHAGTHPDSQGHHGANDSTTVTTIPETNGPNEHAHFGQCNAQAASDGHPNPHSAVAGATDCTNVTHPGNGNGTSQSSKPDTHGDSSEDHTPTSTPAGPPPSTPGSDHSHVRTPDHGEASDGHGSTTSTTDSIADDADSGGPGSSGGHGHP